MQNIHCFSKSLSLTLILSIIVSTIESYVAKQNEPILLNNRILSLIDGVPFGIDAKAIQNIVVIRKKIREIQYGIYNKQKNIYVGRYSLGSTKHSLKTLVALEKEYEEEFARKKEVISKKYLNTTTFRYAWELHEAKLEKELEEKLYQQDEISTRHHIMEEQQLLEAQKLKRKIKREHEDKLSEEIETLRRKHITDPAAYEKELRIIQKELNSKMAPLKKLLEEIKADIMNVTGPFLAQARSSKELLLPLMVEWAEKADRPFSPLLRWHEEENGTEIDLWNRDARSLQHIDIFCTDLVDFNKSIVNSCKKAYTLYINYLIKQKT